MLYGLLLSLNVLVCAALVLVVLMQRSEGGALGTGGGPAGLVTARGAGDLLTRTTWILFALFLSLSLALTLIGAHDRNDKELLNRLKLAPGAPVTGSAPAATPAPTGAPIAPLAPVGGMPAGGLGSSTLPPPPIAAPVAPPTPATRQEAAKPPKPEAAKPETVKPEAPKPAPAKAAKPAHSAASPAASPAAASPAAAAPVITPPPPKADSDAGKTSAP